MQRRAAGQTQRLSSELRIPCPLADPPFQEDGKPGRIKKCSTASVVHSRGEEYRRLPRERFVKSLRALLEQELREAIREEQPA